VLTHWIALEILGAGVAGAIAGTGNAVASLSTAITLAGNVAASSSATCSLSTAITIAGSAGGVADLVGEITVPAPVSTPFVLLVQIESRRLYLSAENRTLDPDPETRTEYA